MPRSSPPLVDRQKAIELLLLWEGRVSRGRMLELFEVHETVASRDIASFRQAYPGACSPLPSEKAYGRNPGMRPTLSAGNFAEYVNLIGGMRKGSLLAAVPICSAEVNATQISYPDFSVLHRAIQNCSAIEFTYRSLNNPDPHSRTVQPHTLIQAGPRWHMRGWCARAEQFRDFNLGRMSDLRPCQGMGSLPNGSEDKLWNTICLVRLVPHNGLSTSQQRLVREEYMQGTAALRFQVRVPMVQYLIQAYRAAVDPLVQTAPEHLLMVDDPAALGAGALWGAQRT